AEGLVFAGRHSSWVHGTSLRLFCFFAHRVRDRLMRPAGLVLVLTLIGAGAAAQTPPATLAGVVVDPSGGVLPSAKVQISEGGRVVQLVTTDANGAFTLTAPRGQYNLLVMLDGFRPQAMVIEVASARGPRPLKIMLPLAAVRQEVLVTGAAA